MSIRIYSDLYDVAYRLKEIDDGYFVVYNTKRGKFELHNSKADGNTYMATFPYDRLDARAVEYTRETRRERTDAVFEEIERHNARIEKEAKYEARKALEENGERALSELKKLK